MLLLKKNTKDKGNVALHSLSINPVLFSGSESNIGVARKQ
jgi:hypothetical protein